VFYVIIYSACIWVLVRRKRQAYIWHIISSTISFTLVSIQIILLVILLAASMEFYKDTPSDVSFGSPGFEQSFMQIAFDMAIFISL
jgi:hypothetical protein